MAEVIFKSFNKELKVSSAGLNVVEEKISRNALMALKLCGYRARVKKPKQFTVSMIKNYDIIVAMTPVHAERIKSDKVIALNIADPYGQDISIYRRTCEQLQKELRGIYENYFKL